MTLYQILALLSPILLSLSYYLFFKISSFFNKNDFYIENNNIIIENIFTDDRYFCRSDGFNLIPLIKIFNFNFNIIKTSMFCRYSKLSKSIKYAIISEGQPIKLCDDNIQLGKNENFELRYKISYNKKMAWVFINHTYYIIFTLDGVIGLSLYQYFMSKYKYKIFIVLFLILFVLL